MKAKLNVTIERDLIKRGKELARQQSMSLSELLETLLRRYEAGQAKGAHWLDQYYSNFAVSKRELDETTVKRLLDERMKKLR